MNTCHQESGPHDERRHNVGVCGAKPDPLKAKSHEEAERGNGEAVGIEAAGVEQRDDENSDEIVDDSKRQQKDPNAAWNGFSEQRQYADSERDVGGGRYRPAVAETRSSIKAEIDQRRNDDPTER